MAQAYLAHIGIHNTMLQIPINHAVQLYERAEVTVIRCTAAGSAIWMEVDVGRGAVERKGLESYRSISFPLERPRDVVPPGERRIPRICPRL